MAVSPVERQGFELEIVHHFGWVPTFFQKMPTRVMRTMWPFIRDGYVLDGHRMDKTLRELIFCAIAVKKKNYYCVSQHLSRLCHLVEFDIPTLEKMVLAPDEADIPDDWKAALHDALAVSEHGCDYEACSIITADPVYAEDLAQTVGVALTAVGRAGLLKLSPTQEEMETVEKIRQMSASLGGLLQQIAHTGGED